MPVNSANQGIPEQQGTDLANLPSAQVSWDGVIENRLVQRFTNEADRTARNPSPNEGEISHLAAEDRIEVFNSSIWYSLYNRIFYASYRVANFSTAANSSTLANVTGASATLPTSGTFGWKSTIFASGVATSNVKFAYTWPAGASALWGMHTTNTAALTNFQNAAQTTSGGSLAMSLNGTTNPFLFTAEGEISMGGTGGTLQLQAAQNASDPTAVLLRLVRLSMWRVS